MLVHQTPPPGKKGREGLRLEKTMGKSISQSIMNNNAYIKVRSAVKVMDESGKTNISSTSCQCLSQTANIK